MQTTPLLSLLTSSIYLYQRTLSPDHGPLRWLWPMGLCRFKPTCSEYMLRSIQDQGWPGVLTGLRQIVQCHPYSKI